MRHAIWMFVFSGCAFAQTGQITGLVSDPAGAVVAGAKVTVTNRDTAIVRETGTNEQGYYTFALLNPGTYELGVQNPLRRDDSLLLHCGRRNSFKKTLNSLPPPGGTQSRRAA
jgi:hypothetical protein